MKQFLVMPGSKDESKECLTLWFVRNGEGYRAADFKNKTYIRDYMLNNRQKLS